MNERLLNHGTSEAPSPDLLPRPDFALVVDDEAPVGEAMVATLRSLGIRATATTLGGEIEEECERHSPDLIVLDLALGETDALEVLETLAERRFDGSIVLVSGRSASTLEAVQEFGRRKGLTMLKPVSKPFDQATLAAALAGPAHSAAAASSSGRGPRLDIREALRHGYLELWYQPKVELRTRRLCGLEALLRLRHPVSGLATPDRFLPDAGSRAFYDMTSFVVAQAAADRKVLAASGVRVPISINASVDMVQSGALLKMIRTHWSARPHRRQLIVEITEQEVVADPLRLRDAAVQLDLYEVGLSIDDFGAGYSSFERIRELPVVELKLDRSFVSGCADCERQRAFCRATLALARQYDLQATAEGVESEAEAAFLAEEGFAAAQGYLFARPMPLTALLETRSAATGPTSRPRRRTAG